MHVLLIEVQNRCNQLAHKHWIVQMSKTKTHTHKTKKTNKSAEVQNCDESAYIWHLKGGHQARTGNRTGPSGCRAGGWPTGLYRLRCCLCVLHSTDLIEFHGTFRNSYNFFGFVQWECHRGELWLGVFGVFRLQRTALWYRG